MTDRIVPGPSLQAMASPVSRFVAPVQQQAAEDNSMLSLARSLQSLNPNLTQFLQAGHDNHVKTEEAAGQQAANQMDPGLALERNRQGWADLIEAQRRSDRERGTNVADRMAAASPHFRRGLMKARAQRLGMGLNDHLMMTYSRNPEVEVGGQMVQLHDVDDATVMQAWVQGEVNGYAERMGVTGMDPVLTAEVFDPLSMRAAGNLMQQHTDLRLRRYQEDYMDEFSANIGLLANGADGSSSEVYVFLERLGISESSGRWGVTNSEGYTGRYQFGDDRLADFNRANGTNFTKDMLNDSPEGRALQQRLARWHIQDIDATIEENGWLAQGYSLDGLRAVAHLGGKDGMRQFVETGGGYNPKDSNGTSLRSYYAKFSLPVAQMQNALNEATANGMNKKAANEQLVSSLIDAAITAGDASMLDALGHIDTGNGPLGNIGWVKTAVRKAEGSIASAAMQAERDAHTRAEWARDEAKRAVLTDGITALMEDPFADITQITEQAIRTGNPALAKELMAYQETVKDRAYNVRTDPGTFNLLRYRVGDTANDRELDAIMRDALVAANAGLVSPSDLGGLMDDIASQRRNRSRTEAPAIRDYRTRLGGIVQDRRSYSDKSGLFRLGGREDAYLAVAAFDKRMRRFADANPDADEVDLEVYATEEVKRILALPQFQQLNERKAIDLAFPELPAPDGEAARTPANPETTP